jgi:hypothetical protein
MKINKLNNITKKKVFCKCLATHFLSTKDTCNSLYLYTMNANRQVATHCIFDATHCNSIVT